MPTNVFRTAFTAVAHLEHASRYQCVFLVRWNREQETSRGHLDWHLFVDDAGGILDPEGIDGVGEIALAGRLGIATAEYSSKQSAGSDKA